MKIKDKKRHNEIFNLNSKFRNIGIMLFLIFFFSACAEKRYSGIKNKEFYSKPKSHNMIGFDRIKLSETTFEVKLDEQLLYSNFVRKVIGYSGKYVIENEKVILDVEKMKCCRIFIEDLEKVKGEKTKSSIDRTGLYYDKKCNRFSDYEITYLTEIGLDYKRYILADTLVIDRSEKKVKLFGKQRIYGIPEKNHVLF